MSQPPRITAAIITLDEERNLPGLLARLAWADEIVVVDGGSSDGTVAIARSHGARVSRRPFDTFAEQRNCALALATGDWVFSIDADERPAPALVAELRTRLPTCRQHAFRVPIRSSIFGRRFRFSGTQDDRPVRLVRRGSGHWVGRVHEVLESSGPVGVLGSWLDHQTLPDLSAFLAKMDRYTTLASLERLAQARRPCWRDSWISPAQELLRRLLWKQGYLDGPEAWAFCGLGGFSQWVLAGKHRRLWTERGTRQDCGSPRPSRPSTLVAAVTGTTLPLLPLVLAQVPAGLRRALAQEGIPSRDDVTGKPAGRFLLYDSSVEVRPETAAGQVAIDIHALRAASPNDPFEALEDQRPRRYAWRLGELTVSEEVAGVDKGAVRERLMAGLRTAIEAAGGVWLKLAAFPFPYRSAFNFRIDHDEFDTHDFQATLAALAGYDGWASHYVCASTHQRHPDALAQLRPYDVGSHGYWHHTFRDAADNFRNIRRGIDVLRSAGIEPVGFAAPHGRFNRGLLAALEALDVSHSSEFGLAYDDLPFFPGSSHVLQIPVHPISLGACLEAADQADPSGSKREAAAQTALAHFERIAHFRHGRGEPVFLYCHPAGRLGRYPFVLRGVLEMAAGFTQLWKTTLAQFAAWWRARAGVGLSVLREGEQLAVVVEHQPAGCRLGIEYWRGSEVARLPLDARVVRFSPGSLAYETRHAEGPSYPARSECREGMRASLRRCLDWQRSTPIDELGSTIWRGWARRTLRRLKA